MSEGLDSSNHRAADSAWLNVAFGDQGAFVKLLCTNFDFDRWYALGNLVHHGLEETTDLCQLP